MIKIKSAAFLWNNKVEQVQNLRPIHDFDPDEPLVPVVTHALSPNPLLMFVFTSTTGLFELNYHLYTFSPEVN